MTLLVAILVMIVALGGFLWIKPHRNSAIFPSKKFPGRITSLAVKPLDDISGDTNQAYFSDGMTEALCATLGNLSALRVPGRSSVMRYKGSTKSIPEMAGELHVDAILEGSVQHTTNRMVVTVQLVEATTDRHLWATNYNRDVSDFLSVQNELALAIANEIRIQVTPEERNQFSRARPLNPEALDAYLKARQHWLRFTPEGFQAAIDYCNRAITLDTNYAAAYAQLSACYIARANFELMSPRDAFAEAKRYAAKSLELEKTHSGLMQLAAIQVFYDWDWAEGQKNVLRALELNKNESLSYDIYSKYLLISGKFSEAIAASQRAIELEPYAPGVAISLARTLYLKRDFPQAIASLKRMTNAFPDFILAHTLLALSLTANGDLEQALKVSQNALALRRASIALGVTAAVLARGDHKPAARQLLDELRARRLEAERSHQFYVSPYYLVVAYTALGESASGLDWLEKGLEERPFSMADLNFDPALDELRNEPRFQAVLKKMNFPP